VGPAETEPRHPHRLAHMLHHVRSRTISTRSPPPLPPPARAAVQLDEDGIVKRTCTAACGPPVEEPGLSEEVLGLGLGVGLGLEC
jgi:hypothetical protein